MQMWRAGLGEEMSQTDGAAGGGGVEGVQKTIIAVMNESGGRSPRAVTLSLRLDPVAPPNFITMTQSHQHSLLRMRA